MPGPSLEGVTAILLAGGRARRFGGRDKGLIELAGRPLVAWVLASLAGQVDAILVSANRHLQRYAEFGYPVVADEAPDFSGPLAGVLAASRQARSPWLLAVPCDLPFLPSNLVSTFVAATRTTDARLFRAADARREHYAVMFFRRDCLEDLAAYVAAGEARVQAWQDRLGAVTVPIAATERAFLNINTPDDLERAEASLHRV